MKKRWIVLAMAVLLSLGGCSGQEDTHKEKATSVYETADMSLDTNIMAVGNKEITLNEFLFYVYQAKTAYDNGMTSSVWDFKWNDTQTIGEYTKEQILTEIAQIKVICIQAEEEGYALTEEESNEAQVMAKQYVQSLPESAKEYNLTEELVGNIYKEHALGKKMYDVVAGTVDTTISDEEANQITVGCIRVLTSGTDRNGNEVNLSQDQIKSAKQRAKSLLKQAKEQEDFIVYAQTVSDVKEVEMSFSKVTGEPELVETAFSMSKGDISDVIEVSNGFCILYCKETYDEEKTIEYKEAIIHDREIQAFSQEYEKWSKKCKIVASQTLLDQISLSAYE